MPVNMFSFVYDPARHAVSRKFPPSETIPDDTLSLRDLVARYTRGQALLPPGDSAVFSDNEETLELHRLDRLDMIQYARDLQQDVESAKTRIEKRAQAKADLEKVQMLERKVREEQLAKDSFDEKT